MRAHLVYCCLCWFFALVCLGFFEFGAFVGVLAQILAGLLLDFGRTLEWFLV